MTSEETTLSAARDWTSIKKRPAPGRSYLIAANYGGVQTYDVAFYNGRKPDGSHWWTLGNVELNPSCIEFYAEIEPPEAWQA